MAREAQHHIAFIKTLGHIFMWWLGVIPLALLIALDIILLHPYASVVSIVMAVVLYRYAKKCNKKQGDIHDW